MADDSAAGVEPVVPSPADNMVEWYEQEIPKHEFTVLVYFRGQW